MDNNSNSGVTVPNGSGEPAPNPPEGVPGNTGDNGSASGAGTSNAGNPDTGSGRFTQEDIDRAIADAKKKWQSEIDEAERLSKLSKDDRAREQLRLDREKFDKEKSEFAREKLKAETARQLTERNLPASMAAHICGADADETKHNIDAFEKEWNEAISAAVNNRLRSDTPKLGTGGGSGNSMRDIISASIKKGF